jgi:hypothetical protein
MACKAGYDRNGMHEAGGSKPVLAKMKKKGGKRKKAGK